MQSGQVVHADGASLKRHLADDKLVVVDFWADWCAPCRAVTPVLDRLVGEFPTLRVVKVDADAHKDLLEEYGVQSLPTLLVFRDGKRVDQLMGKVPYTMIRRSVERAA